MTYPSDCPGCHAPLHLADQHCPGVISCPWIVCVCGRILDHDGNVLLYEHTEREP